MKTYEVIEHDNHTVISYYSGTIKKSFVAEDGNSDYAEYLRYTAWVEAGNNPDDFWTQEGDI